MLEMVGHCRQSLALVLRKNAKNQTHYLKNLNNNNKISATHTHKEYYYLTENSHITITYNTI